MDTSNSPVDDPDIPVAADAIRSLDDRTVERIAAGEVVERPASAVKELIENSLDAGATRISVEVSDGGTDRILVRDDGVGMTESAVLKAIRRHTTSKLRGADALETGISTLGFRGEALYTIAAVSRLTIRTRPRGAAAGTILEVAGGKIEHVGPVGCPEGTTVEVKDLFYNTPARREFLRTTATEFDHVNRVVANYALANPEVAVSLSHEGREMFATPGQGELRGTVMAVWGRDVAESMRPLEESFDDDGLDRLRGLVSDPETTRSRPRFVSTFVNGRYVTSSLLREAILEGYGDQIAADRYPFVVLFCSAAPGSIDVNVHPRKLAVRFRDADTVSDRVRAAVREVLVDGGLIRTTAPRGRSSPDEMTRPLESGPVSTEETRSSGRRTHADSSQRKRPASRRFRGGTRQQTLENESPTVDTYSLPDLDILGQLDETYIVATTEDGLVLIDQHAADERIHFERLRSSFEEGEATQTLVTPVELALTPAEASALEHVVEALEQLGFSVESIDDESVRVTGVPAILDEGVEPAILRETLGSTLAGLRSDQPIETVARHVLADMACYPAITGQTPLSEGSMIDVLEALDACENPYACPHGRPVLIRIDHEELEERFERDYPGH